MIFRMNLYERQEGQTINATNNPRLYRRLVTEQGMSATLPAIDSTRGTNYKVCIFAGE